MSSSKSKTAIDYDPLEIPDGLKTTEAESLITMKNIRERLTAEDSQDPIRDPSHETKTSSTKKKEKAKESSKNRKSTVATTDDLEQIDKTVAADLQEGQRNRDADAWDKHLEEAAKAEKSNDEPTNQEKQQFIVDMRTVDNLTIAAPGPIDDDLNSTDAVPDEGHLFLSNQDDYPELYLQGTASVIQQPKPPAKRVVKKIAVERLDSKPIDGETELEAIKRELANHKEIIKQLLDKIIDLETTLDKDRSSINREFADLRIMLDDPVIPKNTIKQPIQVIADKDKINLPVSARTTKKTADNRAEALKAKKLALLKKK